jgi:hypothetical protein
MSKHSFKSTFKSTFKNEKSIKDSSVSSASVFSIFFKFANMYNMIYFFFFTIVLSRFDRNFLDQIAYKSFILLPSNFPKIFENLLSCFQINLRTFCKGYRNTRIAHFFISLTQLTGSSLVGLAHHPFFCHDFVSIFDFLQ